MCWSVLVPLAVPRKLFRAQEFLWKCADIFWARFESTLFGIYYTSYIRLFPQLTGLRFLNWILLPLTEQNKAL